MSKRRRRHVRHEIERVTGDLEPITDHDLRVIKHALGDRIMISGGTTPPAIAAQKVLDKILRNEETARRKANER